MSYRVAISHSNPSRAEIIQGLTFEDARALACERLNRGETVTIGDDSGHSISGEELKACCEGRKSLTPNLKAEALR